MWVVALQAVGGAAGNTICVHNVVAASAVAGLVGQEGAVIRKTLPVFFYYALIAGSLGYAIVPTYPPSTWLVCGAPVVSAAAVYMQRKWVELRGETDTIATVMLAGSREDASHALVGLAEIDVSIALEQARLDTLKRLAAS